jgi:hypothetical protein
MLHDSRGSEQAIVVLNGWLLAQNYTSHSREHIAAHVREHGTLAGLVDAMLLDAEDEEVAEAIFVESLPSEPWCSVAWSDPGVWTDVDSYHEARERAMNRDAAVAFGQAMADELEAEYQPTPEDLEELAAWSASLDAMDFPRKATPAERKLDYLDAVQFRLSFHIGHGAA